MTFPTQSSPLSSPPPSQSFRKTGSDPDSRPLYRSPKELPFELAQHVQTYVEENLMTQAFNFLISIAGNTVSSTNTLAPVTIPPPSHLALAATITVHPASTTRTNSREKWDQANSALRLLRLIHALVGPVGADFVTAFSFRKYDFRFSRRSDLRNNDGDGGGEGGGDDGSPTENDLSTPYARSQSVWTRAEDFWHLTGWALNCACLPAAHTARWRHYRLFLEFMLGVLENDWQLRTTSSTSSAEESLIWQYIELAAGGHAKARRILRSIFADGSQPSMREFRPIFAHELREPDPEGGNITKRDVAVNIDQDIYGDYMAPDDSDFSDDGDDAGADPDSGGRPWKRMRTRTTRASAASSRRITPRSSTGSLREEYERGEDSSGTTLGDPQALALRLRLLRLLMNVSAHPTLTSTSPTTFPDLEELFTLFVEFVRPLSLPVFASIVLPSTRDAILAPETLTGLCEYILQRILENSSPSIRSRVLLSQEKLEQEYLPFAASKNSVDANARVSLLLESLTRSLAQLHKLSRTPVLEEAVRAGVEKRLARAGDAGDSKRKKAANKADGEAWDWLFESGQRMRLTVEGLKV